jgi:hypothetical protein
MTSTKTKNIDSIPEKKSINYPMVSWPAKNTSVSFNYLALGKKVPNGTIIASIPRRAARRSG